MVNQKIVQLDPNLLQPNPLQLRGKIDPQSINNLVESIKEKGILEPLVVAKTPAGYQIVSGERRWRAAKILGLKSIPVIIQEMKPKEMIEAVLAGNVQREELNPLDRARAFKRLREEFGLSWGEIAQKIGKSVPYVVNTVKLLSLPDALKDGLLSGLISEGHARALGGIGDTRMMIEAYKIVLKEKASVRRAEEIARRVKKNIDEETEGAKSESQLLKSELDTLAQRIKDQLGAENLKVEIVQSKVRLTIRLVLDDSPVETTRFLSRFLEKLKG